MRHSLSLCLSERPWPGPASPSAPSTAGTLAKGSALRSPNLGSYSKGAKTTMLLALGPGPGPGVGVPRGHLGPSVAPTPRSPTEGPGHEGGRGDLRPGQILLPSRSCGNDAARAKNGGSRTQRPGFPAPCSAPGTPGARAAALGRSASEPALLRAVRGPLAIVGAGEALLSSELPCSPKTPRTLRGVVRKASKAAISYPELPAPLPALRPRSSSPASSGVLSPAARGIPSGVAKLSKRVSFEDERGFEKAAAPEDRSDPSVREAGRRKGKQMQDALYDLRRAGDPRLAAAESAAAAGAAGAAGGSGEPGAQGGAEQPAKASREAPPKSPEGAAPILDEPLFYSTLGDTTDTEESLRKTEAALSQAHAPVHEYGGTRHASAVVSARTLAVVTRKAGLVQACEERIAAFEKAQARRDEIRVHLVQDTAQVPEELVRINKFLQAQVHKGGNPLEANKSDFGSFVSSFGLPEGHKAVKRLQEIGSQATDWWAQAALKEAQAGTDTAAVSRMLDLAADILGSKDHDAIVACREVLGNTLANNALRSAQKVKEKDATRVAGSSKPQWESARKSAFAINLEIKTAVAMGAPTKHPSLQQAKAIATVLETEEKDRLAQGVLLFAHEQTAKDEANAAKCDGIPPVGPASNAADAVEREMENVVKEGVPEAHPTLKEALRVGKELRDKDGERKRLLAREKRLAGKS